MRIMHLRRLPLSRGLVVFAAGMLLAACAGQVAPGVPHVYVVRHAEKMSGDDPALTEAGAKRAQALAGLLADAGIARVFSTDTRRTRDTARPLAAKLGLDVEIYDHRDPAGLADAVRRSGESVLVVGHSNTIAELAQAFGADGGEAVRDDEYDRLYVIRLAEPVSSEIRRYGD